MADGSSAREWPSAKTFFGKGAGRLGLVALALAAAWGVGSLLGPKVGVECTKHARSMLGLQLAGTVERSRAALAGCTEGEVRTALYWDVAYIVWYVAFLSAGVAFVAGKWLSRLGGYRVRRLRGAYPTMLGAAVAAGVLDLIENVALLMGLHRRNGALEVEGWLASAAATASWAKWALVAVVVAYVVAGLFGWMAMPARDLQAAAPPALPEPGGGGLGICLSGGGVRAGTFGLGVLQVLDRQHLVDRARWLSAVSGGSYMAGAWAIARGEQTTGPTGPVRPWAEGSAEVSHLRKHLNYLFGRDGKVGGAIATLLVGLAINVASLFGLLWLLARPLGWLIGWFVPEPGAAPGPLSYSLDRRYWLPVVTWGALSVIAFILWVLQRRLASLGRGPTGPKWRSVMWTVAFGAMVVAGLLGFVLIAAPLATSALPRLVRNHTEVLRLFQVLSGGGVAAIVFGVLRKPFATRLPRLGGLLVALLAVLAAAEIANGGALRGAGADRWTYVFVLVIVAAWYYVADPDWWSLQPYYRGRLREAYATRRRPDGTAESLLSSEEPNLADLGRLRTEDPATRGPELLVCTTMNVTDSSPTRVGVPAYSFTFSPTQISFHVPAADDGRCDDYAVPTRQYARIFQRWDTPRLTAMTAVGMSGAAVSSAMGRFNYGSTKALLALANVRLGMWMPNPRLVPQGELPATPGYPRRRLSYLVKEMFGVYDAEDLYLYVTDGGHWENLGLVELIRRGCREIVCVDASGSSSVSFGTIAEAIALAAQELGTEIELPFEPLRGSIEGDHLSRTVPRDCAMGLITYADGTQGVLWYLKASITASSPARLLAYKEKNDIFPSDPTSDQTFDTEQFEVYRLLGEHVAENALALRQNVLTVLKDGPGTAPLPVAEAALVAAVNPDLKAYLLSG